MASSQYRARNPELAYFITTTIIDWVDIFTRPTYKHVIVNSLKYCIEHKGLELFAWVIMSNHIHLVARAAENTDLPSIMRDFKKFTSKKMVELMLQEPESRRVWMHRKFEYAGGKRHGLDGFKVWQNGYHAIELTSLELFHQKIDYIHNNPVKAEFVEEPCHYIYSSASAYSGEKGMLPIVLT